MIGLDGWPILAPAGDEQSRPEESEVRHKVGSKLDQSHSKSSALIWIGFEDSKVIPQKQLGKLGGATFLDFRGTRVEHM